MHVALGEAVTPPQHRSIALNIDFVITPPPIVIDVELHAADGGCTPSEACCEQHHTISVLFTRLAPREHDSRSRPPTSRERIETISASEVLITAPKSAHKYSSQRGDVKDDARLHPHGVSHPSAVFHMHTSARKIPSPMVREATWNLSSTEYAAWKQPAAASAWA